MTQNRQLELGIQYKNLCKNRFINKYENFDILKNWDWFIIKIVDLQSYVMKFKKNSKIKPKIYLSNYAIKKID